MLVVALLNEEAAWWHGLASEIWGNQECHHAEAHNYN